MSAIKSRGPLPFIRFKVPCRYCKKEQPVLFESMYGDDQAIDLWVICEVCNETLGSTQKTGNHDPEEDEEKDEIDENILQDDIMDSL